MTNGSNGQLTPGFKLKEHFVCLITMCTSAGEYFVDYYAGQQPLAHQRWPVTISLVCALICFVI